MTDRTRAVARMVAHQRETLAMLRAAPILSILLLLGLPAAALASPKPCRDASGRVIYCPKPAKPAPERCKDAAGRFVRCGTSGSKPASAPN